MQGAVPMVPPKYPTLVAGRLYYRTIGVEDSHRSCALVGCRLRWLCLRTSGGVTNQTESEIHWQRLDDFLSIELKGSWGLGETRENHSLR